MKQYTGWLTDRLSYIKTPDYVNMAVVVLIQRLATFNNNNPIPENLLLLKFVNFYPFVPRWHFALLFFLLLFSCHGYQSRQLPSFIMIVHCDIYIYKQFSFNCYQSIFIWPFWNIPATVVCPLLNCCRLILSLYVSMVTRIVFHQRYSLETKTKTGHSIALLQRTSTNYMEQSSWKVILCGRHPNYV